MKRTNKKITSRPGLIKVEKITAMLIRVLWKRTNNQKKSKLHIYNTTVKSMITYGAQTWKLKKKLESKLMSMEMDF